MGIGLNDLIGYDGQHILWWQMCVRGVAVFAFGWLTIRLFGRRAFGKQTPLDIIIAIVIGSNLSRTLTGNARFAPTLAATTTIVVLYWLLAHAAARWPRFARFAKGEPIFLVRDQHLDRRAMQRAGVGEGDLSEAARRSGLADLDRLELAVLERGGQISVVKRQPGGERSRVDRSGEVLSEKACRPAPKAP